MRNIIIIIITVCISLTVMPLSAVDLIVGAKGWYANWRPYLIDYGEENLGTGWQFIETVGGIMYGANVGLILNERFSLSFSYLYGNHESYYNGNYTRNGGLSVFNVVGRLDIERHDFDSALIYMLSNSFRMYLGFKYQPLKMSINRTHRQYVVGSDEFSGYAEITTEYEWLNYAPAIGIGYSLSINDHLLFTSNLSLLYLFGKVDISTEGILFPLDDFSTPHDDRLTLDKHIEMDIRGYGINIEPSLVFVVNQRVLITLGFRFQYVQHETETTHSDLDENYDSKGLKDWLYGGYFAVNYRL